LQSESRENAALRSSLASCRERCEALEWLVEVQELAFDMIDACVTVPWNPAYMELRATYKAALAAADL
jgi:hypothetical protein